jgi:[ribosomal protein S5]-alanine N-acetyltransferase
MRASTAIVTKHLHPMNRPLPRIETPRTIVRLAEAGEAPLVLDYYLRNREHLEPLEPLRSANFYQESAWAARLSFFLESFQADRSLNLFVFSKTNPPKVIGAIGFSHFIRGAFHACYLGYSIDKAYEGRGYMREALQASIAYVFVELRLHRIMANYMPFNRRSGGLLRRLGFVVEGYARDYLQINGVWEDHVLTSLTNTEM